MAATKYPDHWQAPQSKPPPVLKLLNTLTRSKQEFVPRRGKLVSWYNCGPTVYDDSHLGHARNYVTQDVIRRVLRDHFGYNVHFVMNITDIDDKIILGARHRYLVDQYAQENPTITPSLQATVTEAWHAYYKKNLAPILQPNAPDATLDDQGWTDLLASLTPDALETLKTQHEKLTMHLAALTTSRAALASATSSADLIKASATVLAPLLDSQKGSTVTDPAIFRSLPAEMEASFFSDMAGLGIERPTTLTRVTEYVPEIVAFVQRIVDNGYAYHAGGSVYFDVKAFEGARPKSQDAHDDWAHVYAKLQPWSKGDMSLLAEGEGALTNSSGKKSAADFALWKGSKPGEPAWDSPWGPGRPGWHIECSVMASAILGDGMDIHSGGIDLAFPHHDNEMAQSEAYHDCRQWVNYFIHTGHLHIEGLKMSKSLKNFITIKEALQRNSARQLRLAFLLQQWHSRMDFKQSTMIEVKAKEALLNNFFANVKAITRKASTSSRNLDGQHHFGQPEKDLLAQLRDAQEAFHEALCDSIDTPRAMDVLTSLVTSSNTYINAQPAILNPSALEAVARWVASMLRLFGLGEGPSADPLDWGNAVSKDAAVSNREVVLAPYLQVLSKFRDEVRRVGKTNPDIMALCDRLRDEDLVELGVALDDQADGTALVKLVSKDVLIAAREEKRAAAASKEAKAEEKRRAAEEAAARKAQAAAEELELGKIPPAEWFKRQTDKFSAWDEEGFPTADKAGEPVTKSAAKKLKKELDAQIKRHDKYLKSLQA